MISNRTYKRALMFSSAAILAGAAAMAQMQPGGAAGQAPQQQQQQQMPNPGSTAQGSHTAAGGTNSVGDQVFVSSVLESDAVQEQLGQLAQQKSESPDVKQLAQNMAQNRAKLDDQLKPLADKLDVHKSNKPSKKVRQELAKLETLSGPQFDEEYIRTAAKDNERVVKDFNSEAQTSQDPTLQLAAKQDAVVLAQHQQALEQVAQTHNITLEAKK
jgi:putative membrane protein